MRTVFSRNFPLAIVVLVAFLAAGQGCNPPPETGDQQIQSERAADPASGRDRYVLTVIRSVTGPTLVRTDTSTCRMWRMRLNKEKWEAVSPETRSPGEGLPVKAGRFLVSSVRSKYGPILLCNDVANGYVYRMPMSGESGWQQIEEPDGLGRLDRIPLGRYVAEPSDSSEQPVEPEPAMAVLAETDDNVAVWRETIENKEVLPQFRVFATRQLAYVRSEETLPALVEALDDPDPAVVVAAVWALKMNDDPEAIPELTKLLSHEDDEVRSASQQAIEALGE